jgi:hypothetical protein
MAKAKAAQTEEKTEEQKFSIILEDDVIWIPTDHGTIEPSKPITRQLDIIEASDLDDAWIKARQKWLGKEPRVQIVDIIAGELTEPLLPSEHPVHQPEQTVTEETHNG